MAVATPAMAAYLIFICPCPVQVDPSSHSSSWASRALGTSGGETHDLTFCLHEPWMHEGPGMSRRASTLCAPVIRG